jgi:hypothetical protein
VDIDKLCQQHKECLLLWDGAFSAARTINPTDANCYMYKLFVMAAIDCHVNIGCSITHKVHLMLCHVLEQMSKIPGGLGEKMEDWVELMHQIGNRARIRFRTTKDLEARALARARDEHKSSNANVLRRIAEVKEETRRKFKETAVRVEDERRAHRELTRKQALVSYYAVTKDAVPAKIVRFIELQWLWRRPRTI